MKKILALLAIAFVTSGCVAQIQQHGYSFEQNNIEKIQVGQTDYAGVLNQLGSPTSKSNFGPKSLYYISYTSERFAFLDTKIIEQKVLSITFDEQDIVSQISQYTLDDARDIAFSENKTEIQGNTMTPIEQIMTNIGKFNSKKPQY